MSAEQRFINWTETARLQLVEAVIKVEREIMINASKNVSRASAGQKIDKWNKITRLLPAELQAKTWSSKRRSYNIPKCYSTFHNLMKAYRDKVAGKVEEKGKLHKFRVNLTDPVCKLLKRREDLLKGKGSVPAERRLIPGSSKRVNASNLSLGRIVQQLATKVGNCSEAQSLPSIQEEGEACEVELESTEEAQNFHCNAEKEQGTKGDETKGRSGKGKIHWTETGCLLVIEAVRQVEEETRNKSKIPIQSSTGRPMKKWERIEILLPPALRGRTWNSQQQRYNKYKCERLFDVVLKAYRDTMRRCRRTTHGLLTKPVCDLLRCLLSARGSVQAENRLKSGSSYSVTRSTSAHDQETLSATGYKSLKPYADHGCSPEWRSVGTDTEQGASFKSEQTNYPESTENAPHFDNETEPNRVAHEKSTERHSADSSLGRQSTPLLLAQGPHNQNKAPSTTLDSTFISGRECEDCEEMGLPSAPPAVHTRAPIRPQARHLKRTSSFVRNNTTLMTHSRYDENLHAMLDGPLRRLDLEFSHLSSWVHSQSVPIGTMLMNEMASSAIKSSKRRKLSDLTSTEPSDDKIDDSLSRYMDFRIGAAFEKVRIRIAEELKNTCAELTFRVSQFKS